MAFLDHSVWGVCHIHADAFAGNRRTSAPLLGTKRRTICSGDGAAAKIYYAGRYHYACRANYFSGEFVLEHVQGTASRVQSVGMHHVRMDFEFSSARRRIWQSLAPSKPWAV